MEKRLRSSLQSSAEEFLLSATKIGFKSVKPSLKALIWNITSSSELSSSLPFALHQSVVGSIESFKQLLQPNGGDCTISPRSPPTKRLRRSSRQRKNTKESTDEDSSTKITSAKQLLLQSLQAYAYIAHLCISHPKKPFSPSDLLPSVQALHDNLVLFEPDQILLCEIANLCEKWWKEQLPGRETLISQSLPFLLSMSLTIRKKSYLHRVYALREAFSLFDFEDESIEDLKLLLVRCIITPLYLKTEEGRRFVAFLFGLSNQLVKEALAIIRSQIPFGRKSMLEAYADIAFRAWKASEGSSRDEIESCFLQGLIEGAIHASSGPFAASIRRVLGGFINQRTTAGVEKLLFCLAEPVLFRSLQVANSNVRQNALHLFLDMFPLEDPDATKEVKDALLDKQFFLLERLLIDDCPAVRVVAVQGSCRILHLFWEVIPSSTITKIMTKVVDDMSHDICSEVRISTLSGIIYLIGNPQTHEILKVLLPRLGHLFHDSVLSVRESFTDLLLAVKSIRAFPFNKVVDLDIILSALANDQPPVAQKITRLLMPSYFPAKVTSQEACNRCLTLIKRYPMAGARLCEFALSEGSSVKSLLELARVFINLALSPDDLNADQIEGLLVGASNLCNILVTESSCKAALQELFSGGKLKSLITSAASGRARTSVFSIAAVLSPDDVAILSEECMGLIMNCSGLSQNVERQAEISSVHKLLLSCGRFDDMFASLTSLLQNIASGFCIRFGKEVPAKSVQSTRQTKTKFSVKTSAKNASRKKSSSSDTSSFEEDCLIAAGAAWQIKDLLMSVYTRNSMLKSKTLELAFSALMIISEVIIEQCMRYDFLETSPVLAYTALAMNMTFQKIGLTNKTSPDEKKNNGLDTTSLELTELDQSVNHLLNCAEKLIDARLIGESRSLPLNSKQGSSLPKQRKISNMLKMVTTVLKSIVDAMAIHVGSHNQERCLQFTSAFVQHVISTLRKHSHDKLQFKEDELKEVFFCLRSSFTYAIKLLNIVLTNCNDSSPPPLEVSGLANDMLDLIASTESYLGSGHATRLVATVKSWIPDIILALGSDHIMTKAPQEGGCSSASDHIKHRFPSWLTILGKVELCEIIDFNQDEETEKVHEPEDFVVFKKLMEKVALLLRENPKVLDAVGVIFLTGSAVGLERKDFGLVLGLVHFVCVKLARIDHGEWEELGLMLACLQVLYPQIDAHIRNPRINEDERQQLESAMRLLEPVWRNYIYEDDDGCMVED
ncbi:PREDICTED: uncharacterized protein LOC104585590 [Nelumbo nucifera]|uniref:Uncharacterized protein LOC104585590 n=2 Tax=Nelumbo nucifera TaxID=4432 RepID=A0A1U7YPT1_NELNU|nr:PREDICTED: uncharacterized protein LOC104585590 [Nelumbo nucifera]XP_010240827.1 PREDICTED: uncharacterized protein LOC104585590 [Nelumbo nucifera]XP_010240828.1 PREDICTED: uncharacterized protein LOC104585590 [Nelumbo nucifera]DAD32913.1 TPA_asm: hypothetical protein HUJ06_011764 [Nelumbo nucifera]